MWIDEIVVKIFLVSLYSIFVPPFFCICAMFDYNWMIHHLFAETQEKANKAQRNDQAVSAGLALYMSE